MVAHDMPGTEPAPARRDYLHLVAEPLLHRLVAVWIFAGGFVLVEPSPYELMFLLVLPVAFPARMGVHRGTLNLFYLIAFFVPFAFIAAFQVRFGTVVDALRFSGVTIFLMFTAYFTANYIADAPLQRMRMVMRAYTAAAVVVALIGIAAYLRLLPGADLFLLYGRAKATFQDPNVYGPFLVLPAVYLLQKVFIGRPDKTIWNAAGYGLLFVGIFVSFSRGAWGHLMFSSLLVFALCFTTEANARQKARMLIMALAGTGLLVVALAGLLSIPAVGSLFAERASLTQSYDTGSTGRFGRQGLAFEMALEHPLGLGPQQFSHYRIVEAPHDTYVTVVHAYGWGGGLIYWCLIGLTLWRAIKGVASRSPNRMLMIPLLATFTALIMESAIIDTDHWRHFFLLIGLIWGVSTGINRLTPEQSADRQATVS